LEQKLAIEVLFYRGLRLIVLCATAAYKVLNMYNIALVSRAGAHKGHVFVDISTVVP
jgi:hypothetical protein